MDDAKDDWIEKRIGAARKSSPVGDDVATVIKDQLQGTMRERALHPSELTDLAKALLDAGNRPPDEGASN